MKSVYIPKVLLISFLFFTIYGFCQNSYPPNTALRNQIRKNIWKELKLKTPQKYRFMTGLVFNSNNCFNLYEDAAKKHGWKPYELHTATAFYTIILKETISGRTFTNEEVKTIYEKTKSNYSKNKTDFKLDNIKKQQKYDALIIRGLWIGTVFELSKKKNPEIQQIATSLLVDFEKPTTTSVLGESKTQEQGVSTNHETKPKPIVSNGSNSKVNDIILRTVTKYGLNGVYIDNEVSILYTNGDIFTNPSKPLNKLNVSLSKRENPKKWRTWQKKGNLLYVTDSQKRKTYDWKKWFKVRSGNLDFRLSGKFTTSDAFGGATVINASTVVFDKQGRFAWKTIKGGNTDWKPIFSKSTSAGTYRINDYTITLRYNNGVEEDFFFGLYPKDNEHFIIGANHFVPLNK